MESARCKAFLESVRGGSFKAAADTLGYTPSGVSQLVTALEKELGFTLLVRTKKGVRPTREGEQMLPVIRSYLSKERDLYARASELCGLTVGSLTIASYPSIAINWLPKLVRRFQKDYPGIHINIKEGIRQEIFHHLDSGEADMGFLAYADPMPYEWIPLAEDDMLAILPENHRLAGAPAFPVRACDGESFIMTSWGEDAEIHEIFRQYQVKPDIRYTTYDTLVAMSMIQMGLGISFMNTLSTALIREHLVKLPLDPPSRITFGVAVPSEEHLSSAAKKFLDYAVRILTREESPAE